MKGTAFEPDRNEAMKLLQDLVKIKDSLYRFASVNNEARNPFNPTINSFADDIGCFCCDLGQLIGATIYSDINEGYDININVQKGGEL